MSSSVDQILDQMNIGSLWGVHWYWRWCFEFSCVTRFHSIAAKAFIKRAAMKRVFTTLLWSGYLHKIRVTGFMGYNYYQGNTKWQCTTPVLLFKGRVSFPGNRGRGNTRPGPWVHVHASFSSSTNRICGLYHPLLWHTHAKTRKRALMQTVYPPQLKLGCLNNGDVTLTGETSSSGFVSCC